MEGKEIGVRSLTTIRRYSRSTEVNHELSSFTRERISCLALGQIFLFGNIFFNKSNKRFIFSQRNFSIKLRYQLPLARNVFTIEGAAEFDRQIQRGEIRHQEDEKLRRT